MSEEKKASPEAVAEPETPAESGDKTADVEALKQQLAAAERKAEENWEKLLRAQAELDNLRKRMERELDNARKYAIEKFAKELLAVVDSLELGLQAAVETDDVEKIREGIELTLKQLLTVFDRFNIRAIDPTGEKFNPDFHQAMATEAVKGVEPDTVVKVFQKGYTLNDRLIRPALVVVAKPPAEEQPRIDEQA
ncbi:molecular chaperone GrpE [Methylomarinovum caldicuralii]|uniref:Protein GrpE n=1 Tax=Methylomarinovum caldicuralii TaxID=438856 RepID=A0AAU9C3E0_9GAMM|nr:nucleotide exchange factor GrpE [Methylomarinovum caldicuralii]BCX82967.1 molecular chaperone GrpE [Methylomarinovum caldicuralii]